jgi:heptaprenyl diphosphate synthase
VLEQANIAGVGLEEDPFIVRIRDRLARVERLIEEELSSGTDLMADALATLVLTEEERFRPMYTVLAASFGPRPDAAEVTTAAAVIEMVHLAALHHEEVLDEAEVRRSGNGPTARWTSNLAILAGDYLFATASRLVSRLGPDAVLVISETFARLVTGQLRETCGAAPGRDEIDHYLAVSGERSGCLLAAAGRFGATYAGADSEMVERMAHLGDTLGTALRISDHVIAFDDTDGDRRTIRALRDPVHTLPVLCALRENDGHADRLRFLLGSQDIAETRLDEIVAVVRSSSGLLEARRTLRRYIDLAATELSALPDGDGRDALAAWVLDRAR